MTVKEILSGKEGLFIPNKEATISNIQELFKDIERDNISDRITQNNAVENVIEQLTDADLSDDNRRWLTTYSGTANLKDFYNEEAGEKDYVYPSWVYTGIHKMLLEANAFKETILLHNAAGGRIIGLLPKNVQEKINTHKTALTVIQNKHKSDAICRLLYQNAQYFQKDQNIILNTDNEGIEGYNTTVGKKHKLIISNLPETEEIFDLIEALDEGGIMCMILHPEFSDASYHEKDRKYLMEKVDLLHMIRLQPLSVMEQTGYDTAFDIIMVIKQDKTDRVFNALMKTYSTNTITSIAKFPEELKNQSVESCCNTAEMYKIISIQSAQEGVSELDFVLYLKRLIQRRVNGETYIKTFQEAVFQASRFEGKRYFSHVLQYTKVKWNELVAEMPTQIRNAYEVLIGRSYILPDQYDAVTRWVSDYTLDKQKGRTIREVLAENPILKLALSESGRAIPKSTMGYESLHQLIMYFIPENNKEIKDLKIYFHYNKNNYYGQVNYEDLKDADIYHGKHGFYIAPSKRVDFLKEGKDIALYTKKLKEKKNHEELEGLILLPQDNVSIGTIILHEGMILRKKLYTTQTLLDIVYKQAAEMFGVTPATRLLTFNIHFTLKSIYDEADKWTSKSDDFLADAEGQFFTIASFALKQGTDAEVIKLTRLLKDVFYKGNKSAYEDITKITKKNKKHYPMLLELLEFVDKINDLRDAINRGEDTDTNRTQIINLVKNYKKKIEVKKILDYEIVNEYLVDVNEKNNDDRWYIIKSLDAAYSKQTGVFKPLIQYQEEDIYFDVIQYINAVENKPDFRTRVNIKKLCENGEKYNGTLIYPHSVIDFTDRKEFIRQATETGEWVIDIDNILRGEYLVRKENYLSGNIGKKYKNVKQFQNYCHSIGVNTDFFNLDLLLAELEGLILRIPQIPNTVIDLDPHMEVVDFVKHVFPFLEHHAKGIQIKDFAIDKTENEGRGRHKYYGFIQNADIIGWEIQGINLNRHMLLHWFNLIPEIKVKRDAAGKVIKKAYKQGTKEDKTPDVEFTSLRDIFIREKFNEFIRTQLEETVREELYENYNNNYRIYLGDTSDAPLEIKGLTKTFRGKDFKLDPYQNRAIRRFIQQRRIYLNHAVGAGKTISALVSGWEGINRHYFSKAMYIVLLKNLTQWQNHIKELFPTAKYIVVNNDNKRSAPSDIAFNDYDFILIADSTFHSLFDISIMKEVEFGNKDLAEYLEVLENLTANYGRETKEMLTPQIKDVSRHIRNENRRLWNMVSKELTDSIEITFDKLGCDALVDDESDEYKNVDTGMDTYLQKVRGIRKVSSNVAAKMRNASRYIQETYNNKNRIDMTATPVSNSATEIFQVLMSITPDNLRDSQIHTFNDFVAAHGRVESIEIVNTANEIEAKPTFAGVRNINQLKRLINACFDILSQEEMNEIKKKQGNPIPEAVYVNEVYPSTPEKLLMNYYSQHQVQVLKEIAKLDKETKRERTQRKNKLKTKIKQLQASISASNKSQATPSEIKELKILLEEAEAERRILSFNGGVLYNNIRSGIVHTKLYNPNIDDSRRVHSKIKKVVENALKSYLEGIENKYPIITFEGEEYYEAPYGRRSINNGQLFFMDRMSRTDIEGFNARDEYVKAIKKKLGNSPDIDKMFMNIDSESSLPMDIKSVKTFLAAYFDVRVADYNKAIKYFLNLTEEEDAGQKKKKYTKRDIAQYLFNNGYVRFLFGSTESMGVGMNLQGATTDIHNIDTPFRPRDFWQRVGRGARQLNPNSQIKIYTYSSFGGSEVIMFQIMRMKENFIRQLFDLKGLDDFTSEASVAGLETGDMDEQNLFLHQLDNMIYQTNDKRIQSFVDQRKELEQLKNRLKTYTAIVSTHENNQALLRRNSQVNASNTEMYMWLVYEILPLIEEKISKQQELDDSYEKAERELKHNEEFKEAVRIREKYYDDRLIYTKEDRKKNLLIFERDQEVAEMRRKALPKREMVSDFEFNFKIQMIEKYNWAISFNNEIMDIFFTHHGGRLFEFKDTEEIKESNQKQLIHSKDYNYGSKSNYYLGQLSRAVKNKISLIGKVLTKEYEAATEFEAGINDEVYILTVKNAIEALQDNSENNLSSLIERKAKEVNENQGVYTDYVTKQKEIARHAGYIVTKLEQMETEEDKMSCVDEFLEDKNRYEYGDVQFLPTPSDYVDEKLVV